VANTPKAAPTLAISSTEGKRPGEDEPIDYLIERTLMRPRDVIDSSIGALIKPPRCLGSVLLTLDLQRLVTLRLA